MNKEINNFINIIKDNILKFCCLEPRLLLDIKYNFKNILITRTTAKNSRYINYLQQIFNIIDKNIKNKKIIIYTELNWIKDIRYETPRKYLDNEYKGNDIFLFFTSHVLNQLYINTLFDIKMNIYICINDFIVINNEKCKIQNIFEKYITINNKKYDFINIPLFKIIKNNKTYTIIQNNLVYKKISIIQKRYLDYFYLNNNNLILKNNNDFILKNIDFILKTCNTYFFLNINSLSNNLSLNIKNIDSEKRFNYISNKYFKYNKKYRINLNGEIIIYLNNSTGFFKNAINYKNDIKELIENIKKYNNKNKIRIRFHPKDNKNFINDILTEAKSIDNNIKENNCDYQTLINTSYCIFIQNSRIILDLWNDGIPIFSSNLSSINIFPRDKDYADIKIINNLEKFKDKLPDRKKILKKYYKHLFFYEEIFTNKEYIIDLFNNQI
jgi:hypothetical protein